MCAYLTVRCLPLQVMCQEPAQHRTKSTKYSTQRTGLGAIASGSGSVDSGSEPSCGRADNHATVIAIYQRSRQARTEVALERVSLRFPDSTTHRFDE